MSFQRSNIAKLHQAMARDTLDRQVLKICFSCLKGFNKRKGRTKTTPVHNVPGRFICERCANDLLAGKTNPRLKVISDINKP